MFLIEVWLAYYIIFCINAFSVKQTLSHLDVHSENHKVLWETEGSYAEVPFIVLAQKVLDCSHGTDRNNARKKTYKDKTKAKKTEHSCQKSYFSVQDTKKFQCPAQVSMKEIIYFKDYKLTEPTEWKKRITSLQIRNLLKVKGEIGMTKKKIMLIVDDISEHRNHAVGELAGISQEIDPRLSKKIISYANEIKNVREMRCLLKIFVRNDLFDKSDMPDINNRLFFPSNNIIRVHMVAARKKLQLFLIDQECLLNKIKAWQKDDPSVNIFFRPKNNLKKNDATDTIIQNEINNEDSTETDEDLKFTENDSKNSLLFVYQSEWQCKLVRRYGNEMFLLDATYKTTRYVLPVFFLVVKTNVDYQIVGCFITENETKRAICEALRVFKKMNVNLSPSFCMTDYCNEEIDALEEIFPGCKVLICDFHREQAWERWLVKVSNGCAYHKADILQKLRKISHSTNVDAMELAILDLKQSEYWSNERFSKLKKYIETYWLTIIERWVWAYRQNRLLVNLNTNNGVERQNKSFKYSYLQQFNSSSLTGMLTILIEEFFPDKYQSYIEKNFKMDSRYRHYAKIIPSFLINRPREMVTHCLKKISLAESFDLGKVSMINHDKS
ncbi:uncharacterized protein LOC124811828 [Hydra vulgaris]|uniref:uncharacterized protein LOC124811828 n=1 Tax=Hydra vulgaris TaxID=6087 RepID=UPI0032E9EB4A